MDALNTCNLLTLAEADTVNTPTWALLMLIAGVLVSCAFGVLGWLNTRAERAGDEAESVRRENEKLQRDLLLSEIKSIGLRMGALEKALEDIKTGMRLHDMQVGDIYRRLGTIDSRLAVLEDRAEIGGKKGHGGDGHG